MLVPFKGDGNAGRTGISREGGRDELSLGYTGSEETKKHTDGGADYPKRSEVLEENLGGRKKFKGFQCHIGGWLKSWKEK